MHTVASPDPNPRGGGQLPNLTLRVQFYANECNEKRRKLLTLTSGTSGGAAPTYTIYTGEGGQLPNSKSGNLR